VANRNLVASVVNAAGDHLADPSTTVIVSEYAYAYDLQGQSTSVNYSGTAFGQIQHVAFGYNNRREVVLAQQFDGASNQEPEVLPRKREYGLDPIGNRLMHADGGASPTRINPRIFLKRPEEWRKCFGPPSSFGLRQLRNSLTWLH
jgi:hypothetical protein